MDYNEKIQIAYKLMKWSGWQTLSGMLCRDEDTDMLVRVIDGGPRSQSLVFRIDPGLHFSNAWAWRETSKLVPQIDDPATLGCLESLLLAACPGCTVEIRRWYAKGVLMGNMTISHKARRRTCLFATPNMPLAQALYASPGEEE
jgi:hypothetical protein